MEEIKKNSGNPTKSSKKKFYSIANNNNYLFTKDIV